MTAAFMGRITGLTHDEYKALVHALLREWGVHCTLISRAKFTDFDVEVVTVLDIPRRLRFRLYSGSVTDTDLADLRDDAAALRSDPIAICPVGVECSRQAGETVPILDLGGLASLCEASSVISTELTDSPAPDLDAIRELRDNRDAELSLLSGLLWLRPLSRFRVPPALRWTGRTADELFESCFSLTMMSTFRATGESWGTRKRGRPLPDGVLKLPGCATSVLYDCKASKDGYSMEYRDVTGFVDYLRSPLPGAWANPTGDMPRLLIISSRFVAGSGSASFTGRSALLAEKAGGAKLTWLRAPDLTKFGVQLERAHVATQDRLSINWNAILDAGDVFWDTFQHQINTIADLGYQFEGSC